ncbi:hypothetical protein [Methyloligella solikamskensis]|uniref:CHAT domain-containing protein n=1 Tax=Methyloligella solikamskensis TaxID=1177756 RepID=A0ABW3J6W9_9HYPH
MIISGHGDEGGFIFGEFAPEIDVSALSNGHLSAEAIGARANLPETVVISTACGTGGKAFASAFLDGGSSAYIAPEGYPDGADAALFVHRLMHGMLRAGRPLEDAFRLAQVTDEPECRFTLYGGESRG